MRYFLLSLCTVALFLAFYGYTAMPVWLCVVLPPVYFLLGAAVLGYKAMPAWLCAVLLVYVLLSEMALSSPSRP